MKQLEAVTKVPDVITSLFRSFPQVFISMLVKRVQVCPHSASKQNWVLENKEERSEAESQIYLI